MMRRRLLIPAALSILALGVTGAQARIDLGFARQDGGQPGAFLDYAASARSLGMGKAHTGVADDASAIYWNPAGLSQVDRKDIVTLYSVLFQNTGFGAFNYAQPTVDWGTFGVGVVDLRSTGYDRRQSEADGGHSLGTFDLSESAFLLSNGFAVGDRWSFGGTAKAVREQVDTYSGSGYGLDLAALYKWSPLLQFGATARNALAPKVKLRNQSETFERELRLGMKAQALRRLLVAVDLGKGENTSVKLHAGGEWRFNNNVVMRAGLDETEVTAGLGFNFGDWGIDYAFGFNDAIPGTEDLGGSHRFGFHVAFGRPVSDQEASLRWQKRGEEYLAGLRQAMDNPDRRTNGEIDKLVGGARQVIRHQGYLKAQDLYTAQGYIYYFEGEYERAVLSLGEALQLEPEDSRLAAHLETARAEMTEDRMREIVAFEIKRVKELYDKGDWRGTVQSCEKILSFDPDHPEAKTYLEEAQERINEPIQREMKIAKLKFDRGEYLDAIKSFQNVKQMDPQNRDADRYISHAIAALEKQAQDQALQAKNEKPHAVYEIARDPDKSRMLYSQGLVLYSQGKVKDAVAVWEQSVHFDGENELARNAYTRAKNELRENE